MATVDPASLRSGQTLRHVQSGALVTLSHRKSPDESHLPGWWLFNGQGGLADSVIADGTWVLADTSGGEQG